MFCFLFFGFFFLFFFFWQCRSFMPRIYHQQSTLLFKWWPVNRQMQRAMCKLDYLACIWCRTACVDMSILVTRGIPCRREMFWHAASNNRKLRNRLFLDFAPKSSWILNLLEKVHWNFSHCSYKPHGTI